MAQLGSKYIQNRAFMDHLGKQLGFHEMDDWYQINQRSIKKGGGDYLLSLYQGSPVKLVQAMYPEHDWLLWKFQMVPKGYWALQQNQRQFLDWLGIQLGFKDLEDWYRLHQKDLIDHGGYTLLSRFHGSPSQLLQSVYPDHVWLLWKFKEAPNGYWKNKEVQKKFMDHLGKDLGFKSMEDWYQLKARNMISKGGAALLGQYNNSPSKLLQSIYPQHSWSLRKVTPKGHWDKVGSQKEFLDWLGRELGFTEMDHWYSLKDRDILDRGGSAIFQKYKGSVSKLLSSVYFEHSWEFWRFETVPKGFWNDLKNHKDFVDWLGKQLGIGSMEGWYNVTFKDIVNKGGATIMYRYYHDSPSTMLRTIYPNHEWLLWKFKMVPKGFWNGIEETELKKFVPWLQRELKVSSLEGWYRISMERISEVVSLEAFAKISLEQMLQRIYPNHEWDVFKFENYKTIKAAQQRLLLAVKEIFPDSEMVENFQLEEIRRNKSSRPIELDVFLPKERLALEYQGEQHYIDLYALGNRWYQKQRDDEKRAACSERSITLIEVPYWWKFNISSLMATIYKARPDLVPDCGSEPISDSPLGEFSGSKRTPDTAYF